MRTDGRTDMTKLIAALRNFIKRLRIVTQTVVFRVLKAASEGIQGFDNVAPSDWRSGSRLRLRGSSNRISSSNIKQYSKNCSWTARCMKMKALRNVETSETAHVITQGHTTEHLNHAVYMYFCNDTLMSK
jgi:hypothetical protein